MAISAVIWRSALPVHSRSAYDSRLAAHSTSGSRPNPLRRLLRIARSQTCEAVYAVGGKVSGLLGSGLALAICRLHSNGVHGGYCLCDSPLQVRANGAFNLGGVYPALYSGADRVEVTRQLSLPTQQCVVGNKTINIQNANDTSVTVSCHACRRIRSSKSHISGYPNCAARTLRQ